jgi:hypothetical protein
MSDAEFHQTFGPRMRESGELLIPGNLLDEYLSELEVAEPDLLDWAVVEIELSYASPDGRFQHLLFPEGRKNVYVVLVANVEEGCLLGHHRLDLNEKYGLPTPPKGMRL